MCGIVGMYTTEDVGFFQKTNEELMGLLVVDSLRGIHSTGVFATHEKSNELGPDIVKAVGNPYELMRHEEAKRIFSNIYTRYDIIVGHNRYATHGDVNAQNAHPFEENHITLVHNGGISNFDYLKKLYNNPEVDSQMIARMLGQIGIQETVYELSGAMALVWYDKKEDSLNFFRNTARPFHIGKYKNRHQIVFASEEATVKWHGLRNWAVFDNVWELPAYQHYKYTRGDITPEIIEIEAWKRIHKAWPQESSATGKILNASINNKHSGTFDKVSLGDSLVVNILDFSELETERGKGNSWYCKAECEKYPDVLVHFTFSGTEDQLIEAEAIKGKVNFISWITQDKKELIAQGFRWALLLSEPEPLYTQEEEFEQKEEEEQIEWIRLLDGENIPKYRYEEKLEVQSGGCGWCEEKINISQASGTMICRYEHKGETFNDILCPKCSHINFASNQDEVGNC